MVTSLDPPSYSREVSTKSRFTSYRRTDELNPPRYDEVIRQFEVLESHPELAELRQIAYDAMAKEAAKPETISKLLVEVRALAGSAKKVDHAFERVRIGLGKVDDHHYRGRDGEPIPKFQGRWISFQKASFLDV
jgi:hypothetical protein